LLKKNIRPTLAHKPTAHYAITSKLCNSTSLMVWGYSLLHIHIFCVVTWSLNHGSSSTWKHWIFSRSSVHDPANRVEGEEWYSVSITTQRDRDCLLWHNEDHASTCWINSKLRLFSYTSYIVALVLYEIRVQVTTVNLTRGPTEYKLLYIPSTWTRKKGGEQEISLKYICVFLMTSHMDSWPQRVLCQTARSPKLMTSTFQNFPENPQILCCLVVKATNNKEVASNNGQYWSVTTADQIHTH
jgi:hypothetical protein